MLEQKAQLFSRLLVINPFMITVVFSSNIEKIEKEING
jgi:hypothetical protein